MDGGETERQQEIADGTDGFSGGTGVEQCYRVHSGVVFRQRQGSLFLSFDDFRLCLPFWLIFPALLLPSGPLKTLCSRGVVHK